MTTKRKYRRRRGATLGLVAAFTFLIAIVGLAFFFIVKILGGGRELQHATDSGNLNVAKQSLRTPHLKLFGSGPFDLSGARLAEVRQNFSELKDPVVGELDLLVYNKAVGQSILVAANAQADNYGFGPPNPQGITNARTLIDLLSNPNNGLGKLLGDKLKVDQQQDTNFTQIASIAPMKMLNPGGPNAAAVAAQKEVAFMVPNMASNCELIAALFPSEFLANPANNNFLANNTVVKNGVTYFKGYSLINIPSVTDATSYPIMGVPLRPREKPHLVALRNFVNFTTSPLPGGTGAVNTRVPPNAFRSAGSSAELKSGNTTQAISCSLAGSIALEGEYKASIPCGFVVVANGNGFTPAGAAAAVTVDGDAAGLSDFAYGGGGGDIFSDLLMNQQVFIMPNGAMDKSPADIEAIKDFKRNNPGQPVPANLASALDGPSPQQSYADSIDPNDTAVACDNYNSTPTSPNANPRCFNNLNSMATTYGFNLPTGGSGQQINGLMAIEKYKAQVINPRPGGGPAIVTGVNNRCTGLKSFTLGGIGPNEPIQFGQAPTVNNLLGRFRTYGQTAALGNLIYNQLKTKLIQIRPESTQGDIDAVLNNPLPMGAIRYIWMDGTRTFKFTDGSAVPPYIVPNNINPDGTSTIADTGWIAGNRNFVNIEGEQGYPSPWDCFGGPEDRTKSSATWTRSSGFNCLQGVLRFMNCADGGGQIPWDCPC